VIAPRAEVILAIGHRGQFTGAWCSGCREEALMVTPEKSVCLPGFVDESVKAVVHDVGRSVLTIR
jgi:hypothetical protein